MRTAALRFQTDTVAKNKFGDTPLYLAIKYTTHASFGCSAHIINMFRALVQAPGVDVNEPPYNVAIAVSKASVEVLQFLLQHGGNANSSFDPHAKYGGEPALFKAIRMNSLTKCRLLVENGADLNAVFEGITPLEYAMLKHVAPDIIELLYRHAPVPVDVTSLVS